MPRDDASVDAAGADDATAPIQVGDVANHVLSPSGALAETGGKISNRSRWGTDLSSRHNSVLVDGGGATAEAAAVHNVAMLAHVCEMASEASPPPRAAVATDAPLGNRLAGGTDTVPRDDSAMACGGAAAQAPDAHNARATAMANANELSRR